MTGRNAFIIGMLDALVLAVLILVIVWLFQQIHLGDAPQGSLQVPPQQNAAVFTPPQMAPPPVVQVAPAPAPQPPTGGSGWTCAGSAVQNGGCLVQTTTNLVAGLCVDYDPRSSVIAGPHTLIYHKSDDTWDRARIDGTAAWQPNGSTMATIYRDPSCPQPSA